MSTKREVRSSKRDLLVAVDRAHEAGADLGFEDRRRMIRWVCDLWGLDPRALMREWEGP